MFKVVTIVGTRPELIKLSRVMSLFDEHVDHKIIHTGQNFDYELNEIFYDDLDIRKPDYFLNAARDSASKTIASVIEKVEDVLCYIPTQIPKAFFELMKLDLTRRKNCFKRQI